MTIQGSILGALLFVMMSAPVERASGQDSVDQDLSAEIQKIMVVDDHSHALPARIPGMAEGDQPDPLGKTAFDYPVKTSRHQPGIYRCLEGSV